MQFWYETLKRSFRGPKRIYEDNSTETDLRGKRTGGRGLAQDIGPLTSRDHGN